MCDELISEYSDLGSAQKLQGYMIVVCNLILKQIVFFIVKGIGYKTETEKYAKATRVTFIAVLVNSAFIPMLITANFSEYKFNFGFNGPFNDFNMYWYTMTGNVILHAQIFNCYFPIILFTIMWSIRALKRLLDRSCTSNRYKTKAKSIQTYIDKYSGPEFLIHNKYNAVINDVFIAMIFGFGMPMLFPITVASLCVRYIMEVSCLFYCYKEPPTYDRAISDWVYAILLVAPAFFLSFSYWQISNMQLLSNDYLTPITLMSDIVPSQHTISTIFGKEGWQSPSWLLLTAFVFMLSVIVLKNAFAPQLKKLFKLKDAGEDEHIDEGLEPYWQAIHKCQLRWTLAEEDNCRNNIGGMRMMLDEAY